MTNISLAAWRGSAPAGGVLAPAVVCPQIPGQDATARAPLQGDAEITPVTAREAPILSMSVPREKLEECRVNGRR